jgi:hypothetical protein
MFLLLALGCLTDPSSEVTQGVGYRDPLDDGPQSGERGTIKITEVLWSGAVRDGVWDPADVFVELRNESNRPMDLGGWRIRQTGTAFFEVAIPDGGPVIEVGGHAFVAAKADGCFPSADWVTPGLRFVQDAPFELTLVDADERLIEPIGDDTMPPFAGGFDGHSSRSMERVELMFGAEGTFPHTWHYYTPAEVAVPNDDRIDEGCRARTRASPGRPNSPDYSGAQASGSFE